MDPKLKAALSGVPGLERAVDRIAGRAEAALERAAAAVEQGMDRIERALDRAGEAAEARPGGATAARDAGPTGHGMPGKDGGHADDADPAPGFRPHGDAGTGAGPAGAKPDGDASGPRGRGPSGAYAAFVERTRTGVAGSVSKGLHAIDAKAGDRPWQAAGLDPRRVRIAREVMREVVPEVAGDRVASAVDGAAMKGGIAGAGLLLRVPLKGFAAPFLLGIAAVETVRAVKDVRARVDDVAARVDNEARSREAYESGAR